jgi:hypothetical protein
MTDLVELVLNIVADCLDRRPKMQFAEVNFAGKGGLHAKMPRRFKPKEIFDDLGPRPGLRALLASRALLVKIKRDLENQVRGLLKNVGLLLQGDDRRSDPLQAIEKCRRLCRIDDPSPCFRRDRLDGTHLEVW